RRSPSGPRSKAPARSRDGAPARALCRPCSRRRRARPSRFPRATRRRARRRLPPAAGIATNLLLTAIMRILSARAIGGLTLTVPAAAQKRLEGGEGRCGDVMLDPLRVGLRRLAGRAHGDEEIDDQPVAL